MTIEYKVGMRLWMQSSGRLTASRYVTVEKVGRKWVTLGADTASWRRLRVELGSRNVEGDGTGHNSAGTLYLTREDYEQEAALRRDWIEFRNSLVAQWPQTPNGVTREKIAEARKVLGMEAT